MSQPTPAEIARLDQVEAHNSTALDRIADAARDILADGVPRWVVERSLRAQFHDAEPCTIHNLLALAIVRQALHTCTDPLDALNGGESR